MLFGGGAKRTGIAVGKCCFCDATDDLTDEHVVPKQIGGHAVLERGTCPRCQKITQHFENICYPHHFAPIRAHVTRPRTMANMRITRQDKRVEVVSLEVGRHPIALYLPAPFGPSLLPKPRSEPGMFLTVWSPLPSENVNKRIEALISKEGAMGFPIDCPWKELVRYIAKVAHCYTVLALGITGFEPVLTEMILGGAEDWRWVGAYPRELTPEQRQAPSILARIHDVSHDIVSLDGRSVILVSVKLFTHLHFPEYKVISGFPTDAGSTRADRKP